MDTAPVKLGRYEITSSISDKSVFFGVNSSTSAPVVIKTSGYNSDGSRVPNYFVAHEFRIMNRLDHPFVPKALELFHEDGIAYFAMPHYGSRTLGDLHLRRESNIVRRALVQVGSALGHAHKNKVLHRDVKPFNIIANGTSMLIDWGQSCTADDPHYLSQVLGKGTTGFRSPEEEESEPPTTAQDVFSFSATFYWALTGRIPFDKTGTKTAFNRPRHTQKDLVPYHTLGELIGAGLSYDAENRPSMKDIVEQAEREFGLESRL